VFKSTDVWNEEEETNRSICFTGVSHALQIKLFLPQLIRIRPFYCVRDVVNNLEVAEKEEFLILTVRLVFLGRTVERRMQKQEV
jgi:hypothetical protein